MRQFGNSRSNKHKVASVHAPASANSSSTRAFPDWRRDLNRVLPSRTLRNKLFESADADCSAASNSSKSTCQVLCMVILPHSRRGDVPIDMSLAPIKKPDAATCQDI